MNLADLGHGAVAVEHDRTSVARDHLAPERHVGERLVHLELQLEAKRVPRNEKVAAGRTRMAGDGIGDDDAPLLLQNDSARPGHVFFWWEGDGNLSGQEAVTEGPDRLTRWSDCDNLAVLEHDHAFADLAYRPDRVRDDDDRAALGLELVDPVEALFLESLVPDGEHLVDEQHVGLDVHRDGEAEPDVHARGVEPNLVVDELLELRERDDVVEATRDLSAGKTQQ